MSLKEEKHADKKTLKGISLPFLPLLPTQRVSFAAFQKLVKCISDTLL